MPASSLAIDFGTSNSAAAWRDGSRIAHLRFEAEADSLPTAVFFPAEGGPMRIGHDAGAALVAGEEGRYMRALKSVLGTPLLHESRLLGGRRQDLAQVISSFLVRLKERAEAQSGKRFDRAVSGRPVRFHDDLERDAQAEADLTACYLAAGFEEVRFVREPVAAARSHAAATASAAGEMGLVVDIGGGTSDFTLYRRKGDDLEILASHGIRLGGTDFDQSISMAHAMPVLGLGGALRRSFGTGTLPVPRAIYGDLSNWAKIPFLYAPAPRRAVRDMLRHAEDAEAIARLETVLTDELGHALAFSVEAGKIAANRGLPGAAIDMGMIGPGLTVPLDPGALGASLEAARGKLRHAMERTLAQASVAPDAVDALVLVGGASLMGLVHDAARDVCAAAVLRRGDAFRAVIDGLARSTDP